MNTEHTKQHIIYGTQSNNLHMATYQLNLHFLHLYYVCIILQHSAANVTMDTPSVPQLSSGKCYKTLSNIL